MVRSLSGRMGVILGVLLVSFFSEPGRCAKDWVQLRDAPGIPQSEVMATEPVPLSWIRGRARPSVYHVATGDVIGVYIEGVVPPPQSDRDTPEAATTGTAVTVDQRGNITLPLIGDIHVDGLTIEEAEKKTVKAVETNPFLKARGKLRVLLGLRKERLIDVTVLRLDTLPRRFRSREFQIKLPSSSADVLSALGHSGGLPAQRTATMEILRHDKMSDSGGFRRTRIPIPLRKDANTRRPSKKQIELQAGDIVVVRP